MKTVAVTWLKSKVDKWQRMLVLYRGVIQTVVVNAGTKRLILFRDKRDQQGRKKVAANESLINFCMATLSERDSLKSLEERVAQGRRSMAESQEQGSGSEKQRQPVLEEP